MGHGFFCRSKNTLPSRYIYIFDPCVSLTRDVISTHNRTEGVLEEKFRE